MCLRKILSEPIDVVEIAIGLVDFLCGDYSLVERVIIKMWPLTRSLENGFERILAIPSGLQADRFMELTVNSR